MKLVKLGNADPDNIPSGQDDDFANIAARTVPHPANDVLQNPSITVRKFIPDPEGGWQPAPADSWEFCGDKVSLLGGDACKNNPAVWGEVIAETAETPGTDFTFTENQLVGPEYQFDHVDGDNCVEAGTTAVATVKADFNRPQNAVCNFYNSPAPGSLQLVKRVINDNGGTATVEAFGITTSAGSLTFGDGEAEGADTLKYSSNVITVSPGEYTFSENNVAGYTEDDWSCTGAEASGTAYNAGAVTVPNGGTVVCTITNDDDAPSLTLIKHVVNDNGGTAVASDWDLTATGSSRTFTELTPALADATYRDVTAGVEYTLTETGPAGYSPAAAWVCTDTATPDQFTFTAPNKVTVALGGSVTCQIVNDDVAPKLKLVKDVQNNDGGTAVANDWTLTADAAGTDKDDRNISTLGGAGTLDTVYAGVAYALAENPNPGTGYSSSSGEWSVRGTGFDPQ